MDRKAAYESGGAGLVSTIEDYSVFARMLLDRGSFGKTRILKPEAVDRMLNAGLNDRQQAAFDGWFGQKGYRYGCLMRVLQDPAAAVSPGLKGEYCWDGWLGCSFFNYPRENMTLLVKMCIRDSLNTAPLSYQRFRFYVFILWSRSILSRGL